LITKALNCHLSLKKKSKLNPKTVKEQKRKRNKMEVNAKEDG
jgi:hypothetical protein